MIAGVLGPQASATAARLLSNVTPGSEPFEARVVSWGRCALAVDARVPAGHLDETARMAWVGKVRDSGGLLTAPGSVRGDYGLIAARDSEIVLARGRFGGRPLFFTWLTGDRGRSLVVSSRLEPLVGLLPARPLLDRDRLAASLLRSVPRDHGRTHYEGIRRVPSAAILSVDENDVRATTSIPFPEATLQPAAPDDLADSLQEKMRDAVARAIEGASRVGVFAGGGVDSSAVLAMAVKVVGSAGIQALNVEFAAEGDDRPHFAALCRALGIDALRIPPEEGASDLRRLLVVDAAPYPDGPQIGWMVHLVKLARQRGPLDLVLTGDGGDPLFDGDRRVFAARAREGDVVGAVRAAWKLRAIGTSSGRQRVDHFVFRPIVRSLLPAALRDAWRTRDRGSPRWGGPFLKRFLRDGIDVAELEPEDEAPSGAVRVARLASSGLMTEARDQRGQLEVAMDCECADPLFDDELGEWVAGVPPELLYYGEQRRGLFRHALRGLVPDSVRLRDDKSRFEPSLARQVERLGGLSVLRTLAESPVLADLGLVEPRRVLEAFDALASAPGNGRLWAMLWPVLSLEAFAARHEGRPWK